MTEEASGDHSFVWWLCMLPFLAAMGVFMYRWMHNQSQGEYLGYAVGSLIIGVVFSAFIAGAGKPDASEKEGSGETKPSGGNGSEKP